MRNSYYDYTIAVTSGTGQALTDSVDTAASAMELASIKAPNAAAVYDFYIYDKDDYLIYFEEAIVGDGVISLKKISASQIKLKILNATVDGNYLLRLYTRV